MWLQHPKFTQSSMVQHFTHIMVMKTGGTKNKVKTTHEKNLSMHNALLLWQPQEVEAVDHKMHRALGVFGLPYSSFLAFFGNVIHEFLSISIM